ncbi:subtilisin-like protein [Myriangium duriaei CBS 260.36]|uniref:Subtilisin-like protein n=1 Tax=Myriangium duriaei CBS 260.36 TaxID=1168546 RepID=A0A9P4MCD4_9PEZI|nr:subtilisin-like protein [Myriangium duriaei CBS 260.36]
MLMMRVSKVLLLILSVVCAQSVAENVTSIELDSIDPEPIDFSMIDPDTTNIGSYYYETINMKVTSASDRFIVTLKPGVDVKTHVKFLEDIHALAISKRSDGQRFDGVSHQYNIADFLAYAGHFEPTVIKQLRDCQDVLSVEPDQLLTTKDLAHMEPRLSIPWQKPRRGLVKQEESPWGLHYISHKHDNHTNEHEYIYDRSSGTGTYAYIVDTGIWTKHSDFQGRASLGYNAIKTEQFSDTDGHGTFVASIVGGKYYGVAKKTNLIAVKVIGQNGTTASIIIDGYIWAVNHIQRNNREAKAVINLSISTPRSEAFNRAVDAAFAAGITTVAAVGNQGISAQSRSPASAEGCITVAHTDQEYEVNRWANHGPEVDIFAPGTNVQGAGLGGKWNNDIMTGSSFAAPHVSGLVVYAKAMEILIDANSTKEWLLKNALPEMIFPSNGARNLFAYNGNGT